MTPLPPLGPGGPDAAALLRYVSSQSPLGEAQAIRTWIAADPTRQASFEELQRAWGSAAPVTPTWDKDGVWARLAEAHEAAHGAASAPRPTRSIARRPPIGSRASGGGWNGAVWVARVAAVMLLTVGVAGIALIAPWRTGPVTMHEFSTARGKRTEVELADGSRVTLDATSRLRVPNDLATKAPRFRFWHPSRPRRLELTGRALFDVKHDPARPFVVETSTATTQDVGTSFVITSYPDAATTQVAVVDGSVALWDRSSAPRHDGRTNPSRADHRSPLMTLTQGDVATLGADGTATRARPADLDAYTSWTRGVLTFAHVPLREVILELGRWYDLDVRLSDSALGARLLTAEIRTESASEAVERLALVLDLRVTSQGRTVVLSPRSGSSRGGRR